MAKRPENDEIAEIAENVSVHFSPDGVQIPTSTDMAVMRELTDDVLRGIGETGDAFADAVAIAEQLYGGVQELAEEFGSGFQLLADKTTLVGKKFLLLKWTFTNGDHGVFCSAAVVTVDGGKYIVNDGSTGICTQLREYSIKHGRFGGFVATRGLRASQYATCKGCGQPRTAFDNTCSNTLKNGSTCGDNDTARGTGSTYYLDLSA
jgi:hypothetical protein